MDLRLRWHVFRCRRQSDTRSRFLLELARAVARAPRAPDAAPMLEIGTRSGGSALLMLRVLRMVYRGLGPPPMVLTVDPYGARPYEGAPFVYDERHYRAMKRNLAGYANHVHYMMDSELFVRELEHLYLWGGGVKRHWTGSPSCIWMGVTTRTSCGLRLSDCCHASSPAGFSWSTIPTGLGVRYAAASTAPLPGWGCRCGTTASRASSRPSASGVRVGRARARWPGVGTPAAASPG